MGAGNLITLMFGLSYEWAVITVGGVMLAYVLFGGMIATTWVQIIKAILLMIATVVLSLFVLERVGFNPIELFNQAADASPEKEKYLQLRPIPRHTPGHAVARPCPGARRRRGCRTS